MLIDLSQGLATWAQLYPGSGGAASDFPTNSGTATQVLGVLNVLGTGVIQTSGAGNTVTEALTNGTNGQTLIGGGASAAWSTITAGSGITITNAANSITISAAGAGGASSFHADVGTAVPMSGVLDIFGGELIGTTASGHTLVTNVNRGTNGQIPIAKTGGATAYANITSLNSSVTITNGGNTIDLSVPSGSNPPGTIVQKKRSLSKTSSVLTPGGLANAFVTPTTGNTSLVTNITMTPTSATDILTFKFVGNVVTSGNPGIYFCLFQGTSLLLTNYTGFSSVLYTASFLYQQLSGTTSSTVYSIRVAGSPGANIYINRDASGDTMGGSLAYTFTIAEEVP